MSKTAKVIMVLCCLLSILVIFIAPTVDSPDTVIPSGHHSLRAADSTGVSVLLQVSQAAWHSDASAIPFHDHLLALCGGRRVSRQSVVVLRC
jgi:hypothetical protein